MWWEWDAKEPETEGEKIDFAIGSTDCYVFSECFE